MNHLAHCFLARHHPDWMVGNLVADYARGKVANLPYPTEIRAGIAQHRCIDSFTDSHAVVQQACKVLHATQHKFAPIVIDVCFDFFLARHWDTFCNEMTLADFGHQACAALVAREALLPEPLQRRLPIMTAHNFLTTYQTTEGMYLAFNNIMRRTHLATNLSNAVEDVLANEVFLENCFLSFFPTLQAHCTPQRIIAMNLF